MLVKYKMPVNLDKVTKKITKKKGGRVGSLHENSRDTQALRKASARHDRLERAAALVASGRETLSMYLITCSAFRIQKGF